MEGGGAVAAAAAATLAALITGALWYRLRSRGSSPLTPPTAVAVVTGVFVHPVKGMKAHSLQRHVIDTFGLQYDRRWMVVRAEDGVFVTQRQNPVMATLVAEVLGSATPQLATHPAAAHGLPATPPHGGGMVLRLSSTRPPITSVDVPVVETAAAAATPDATARGCCLLPANVWGDVVAEAVDQGDAAAEWLSRVLDTPGLRLVFMADAARRPLDTEWARAAPSDTPASQAPSASIVNAVSFADGFPMLVVSEESVVELNRRVASAAAAAGEASPPTIPMARFRPNITVSARAGAAHPLPPNDEDEWQSFTIGAEGGSVPLWGLKKCSRCIVTTTDQDTGEQAGYRGEPLATMRTYRAANDGGNKVYMGMNVCHEAGAVGKTVAVGDLVTVHQRAPIP